MGSLVQDHSLSFPLFLVIITRLSVCFGGGLEEGSEGEKGRKKERERMKKKVAVSEENRCVDMT